MENIDYKKASIYYLAGNIFNKGMGFFTVPIFTRILTTSDYGTISTYNAWQSILVLLLSMALYMAIKQVYIQCPEKADDYHSTINIFITLITILVLAITFLIGRIFKLDVLLISLCIVHSYAYALTENYSMSLMMKYEYKKRTALMVLPNLISVGLSIICILYIVTEQQYLGRIIPAVVVEGGISIFLLVKVFQKSHTYNTEYLSDALAISVPLIAHGISLSILNQSDRMMISALVGEEKTAIYSVVYNFSMIATALSTALTGVWAPWFMTRLKQHTNDDVKQINDMSKKYTWFMAGIMCGVVLVAPEVLKLLASEPYWDGVHIIPPIVMANLATFIYTFYVDVEHYYKKTKRIAVNTIIAASTNLLLNWLLIPVIGYEAAAYTTLISYVVSLLIHYICARKLEPEILVMSSFKEIILLVIGVCLLYYLTLDFWMLRWGAAVILVIVILWKLKKAYVVV